MTEKYDIHIKGGTVVDGTRAPRKVTDVWVKDGKIARIGEDPEGTASEVIEAEGLVVCPGFVPLRCPDSLGPVLHYIWLARCYFGGAW